MDTNSVPSNGIIEFRAAQTDPHFRIAGTGVLTILGASLLIHEFLTTPGSFSGGAGAIPLALALIAYPTLSRETIVQFDTRGRKLRIVHRWFNRWDRTVVDCLFDQCAAIDVIEFKGEERNSYGVYVRLQDGTRHTIPLKGTTFHDATETALHLCDVTRIPQLAI